MVYPSFHLLSEGLKHETGSVSLFLPLQLQIFGLAQKLRDIIIKKQFLSTALCNICTVWNCEDILNEFLQLLLEQALSKPEV